MASIQSKKSKTGKITYYVVVCFRDQHKWLKAGTLANARILKREVEAMEQSRRMEKLGLGAKDVRVDDFFDEYLNRVKLTSSANTVKRYRAGLNAFVACVSFPNR